MRWGRLAFLICMILALLAIAVMDTMHGRRYTQSPQRPIPAVSVP